MSGSDIVIVSSVRTPMGGFQGSLGSILAVDLGAIAIREAVARAGIQPADVQEVIMGCVLPAGLKQGPARQASLNAGLPAATGCTTINKLCGSGMKAVMQAHDALKAGSNQIMVAGGMESMSNAPYIMTKARAGLRMGHGEIKDHMFLDGLEDARTGRLMGSFAQDTADQYGITREEMDAYAIESLKRAQAAINDGSLASEIVPVTVSGRKGDVIVKDDEQPFNANPEKIPTLKPAFKKDGTVTAANASSSMGVSCFGLVLEGMSRIDASSESLTAENRLSA
jgi:acetyl-CoA C-acetyltransferase